MQCVSGSAIPLTMAIASQTGVKGIASGALKIIFKTNEEWIKFQF